MSVIPELLEAEVEGSLEGRFGQPVQNSKILSFKKKKIKKLVVCGGTCL